MLGMALGHGEERSEVARVRQHLLGAERAARATTPSGLSLAQRRNRARLLDALAEYRRRGRFPKNRDFRAHLAPVFVDDGGTRCAVAHLLELAGQRELVEHIASRVNNVRVKELANERELRRALALAGLTLDEAARIQPSYCFENTEPSACICQVTVPSMLELTVVAATDAEGVARARVDAVNAYMVPVAVGDEVPIQGSFEVGRQLWVRLTIDDQGKTSFTPLDYAVTTDSVTCVAGSSFATSHPIPKDAARQALLAARSDAGKTGKCRSILAAIDEGWIERPCDDSGCGCRLVRAGASPLGDLAVAAVFGSIALLALVRKQRVPRSR